MLFDRTRSRLLVFSAATLALASCGAEPEVEPEPKQPTLSLHVLSVLDTAVDAITVSNGGPYDSSSPQILIGAERDGQLYLSLTAAMSVTPDTSDSDLTQSATVLLSVTPPDSMVSLERRELKPGTYVLRSAQAEAGWRRTTGEYSNSTIARSIKVPFSSRPGGTLTIDSVRAEVAYGFFQFESREDIGLFTANGQFQADLSWSEDETPADSLTLGDPDEAVLEGAPAGPTTPPAAPR